MSYRDPQQRISETIENSFSNQGERIAKIEEREKFTATKEDITRLEGKINASIVELEGRLDTSTAELKGIIGKSISDLQEFITKSVSQSEIKTLKQFVTFWVTIAGLSIPILSTVFYILANQFLPRN